MTHSARAAARAIGATIYHARRCFECGTYEKYVETNKCVECENYAKAVHAGRIEGTDNRTDAQKNITLPKEKWTRKSVKSLKDKAKREQRNGMGSTE